MKDDYLLGACLYVVGAAGGWPKWESFENLGGIINRLEAFQRNDAAAQHPRRSVA